LLCLKQAASYARERTKAGAGNIAPHLKAGREMLCS